MDLKSIVETAVFVGGFFGSIYILYDLSESITTYLSAKKMHKNQKLYRDNVQLFLQESTFANYGSKIGPFTYLANRKFEKIVDELFPNGVISKVPSSNTP